MTFALGIGVMGVLLLYAGVKNLSIKQAVQGNTSGGGDSSAATLANAVYTGGGANTAAVADAGAGNYPSGVAVPKASWNPNGKPVAKWIVPYLDWAAKHGWRGSVTSGFRTRAEQETIYASGVRPAAKPGTSNHEASSFPGGAVDVSNPAQLASVLRRYPGGSALKWAGAKDPVHFSNPHNGSY